MIEKLLHFKLLRLEKKMIELKDGEILGFLEELVMNYKGTILIVSHDRYFLDKVITKTILLENGKEQIFLGNYK